MRRIIRRTAGTVAVAALVLSAAGPATAAVAPVLTPTATATGTAPTATATATPSVTTTDASPTCPEIGAPPAGVSAAAGLVAPDRVQVRLAWTPLTTPSDCPQPVTEIEQVTPPGPTVRVPASAGQTVLPNLRTLTDYTWRLRHVGATTGEWATVSARRVLPLDYCLGLPGPRPIVATTPSPTSVHLEWGTIQYPAECSGSVTVRRAGTTVATVGRDRTGTTITGLEPGSTSLWEVAFFITLGTVTVTQPSASAAPCTATARLTAAWNGGMLVDVTVTNVSAVPLPDWTTNWDPPSQTRVVTVWNARWDGVARPVTAANPAGSSALAPGATASFGLYAAGNGPDPLVPVFSCGAGTTP